MGRSYLPATRAIPRAMAYPAHAFPEALQILEQVPLQFPFAPPMFDLTGVVLPWFETVISEVPNTSVIVRYKRDLDGPLKSACDISPPIYIPYYGNITYQVEWWPEDTTFLPPTYPNPEYILHRMFINWTNWPASPWGYRNIFGTLEGQINIGGWQMFGYQAGLASPPCALDMWPYGWASFTVRPAPWSIVDQRISYLDLPPIEIPP